MFVKVGGPNGSGKTTLTTALEIVGREQGLTIERVSGRDILMELCGLQTLDELRNAPEDLKAANRPKMYDYMYEKDRKDPGTIRIRDAHFSLYNPELRTFTEAGAQPGDKEQMLMLVVLNPDPELLLKRRLQDEHRPDRITDPDIIAKEIEHSLLFARRESEELGVRLLELPNPDDLIKETTLEVIQAIQETRTGKEGGYLISKER